jgi:heme-degrading monooxygenase HmoA
MIRAIYRWRVKPGEEGRFVKAWSQGTDAIRERVKGARGSLLLRDRREPSESVAIARWDSFEDWQAFSSDQTPAPEAFHLLSSVSTLLSTEVFDEVHDLLVDSVQPWIFSAACSHPSEGACESTEGSLFGGRLGMNGALQDGQRGLFDGLG